MQSSKWVKALLRFLAVIAAAIAVTLCLAGYFYLWKNKLPVSYSPFTVFDYWEFYGDRPKVKTQILWCVGIAAAFVTAIVVAILMPKKRALHGDAKWATLADIEKADPSLTGDKGIILGVVESFYGLRRKFLTLGGQLGVILAAPPRSGKGAGVVNPNMLTWPDSAVVLDIRKECWRVTSGFRRKHGQQVFLFNPLAEDGRTSQWNPLSYVSDDPILRINDLQKIANALSPDPEGSADPFWPASCRTLFLGLGLYVFETPGMQRTIGEMVRQIMFGEGESVGEHWKKIIEERQKPGNPLGPLSDTCQRALFDFIFTSANTQSSIRKTFTAKLELWLNPLVDAATSGDSFDLRDLRKKRISIYLGVDPADLKRVSLVLNLFMQQLVDVNTREMPEDNKELKYQVLLMMDEFTALGRMNVIASAVSYLGGFNLRLAIIIQSPSQLRSIYGKEDAETIIECMGAQVCFAPKDINVAKEISENLGYTTVKSASRSTNVGLPNDLKNNGSKNTSDHSRALLLPQEVKTIGKAKQIIFIENVPPILCNKVVYFKDALFKSRLLEPAKITPIKIELPRLLSDQNAVGDAGKSIFMSEQWNEVRDLHAEDLDDSETPALNFKDFVGAPDTIVLPKDPISDAEMQSVVDDFLATISS